MKKFLSYVMCGAVLISTLTLTACGKDTKGDKQETSAAPQSTLQTTTETKREPATITIFSDSPAPEYAIADTRVGKKVLEELNVTLNVEYLVGDKETKEGVLIASGELPDIVAVQQNSKYINAGVVIPLNDLVENNVPNIKESFGSDYDSLKNQEGKIYSIPIFRAMSPWSKVPLKAMYIQQAVLKEFGYPKITTIDEYFDIIKKYQDKYPEINGKKTIGFEMLADDWRFGMGVMGPVKFLNGFQDDGEVFVRKTADGKYKSELYYASDEAKNYFKKINELYLTGYLDKECFTTKYDQYKEKIASGRVLGFHDQRWQYQEAEASMINAGMADRVYVGLPIVAQAGIQEKYMSRDLLDVGKGLLISTSCKQPERVIQFVGDCLTEDMQKLINWGEKDVDYSIDASGKFFFTPEQQNNWKNDEHLKKTGILKTLDILPKVSNDYKYADGNIGWPSGTQEATLATCTDQDKEVCNAYGWKTLYDAFKIEKTEPYGWAWAMDPKANNNEAADFAKTAAGDVMKNYIPKAVLTKDGQFDKVWEEFRAKLAAIDTKSYTDFIDAKIAERVDKNNPVLP